MHDEGRLAGAGSLGEDDLATRRRSVAQPNDPVGVTWPVRRRIESTAAISQRVVRNCFSHRASRAPMPPMIHQFAELGQFYRQREGVGGGSEDHLALYSTDPSQKFRTTTVLVVVFSAAGFERVQVEQYDTSRKLQYLYRVGPSNGFDATATTGIPVMKNDSGDKFDRVVQKKLLRLSKSARDALQYGQGLPDWEATALAMMSDDLATAGRSGRDGSQRDKTLREIVQCHPGNSKEAAIMSVAWHQDGGELRRVGDFEAFRQALRRKGDASSSSKKGISGEVKGTGQCSICGKFDVEVSGLLQMPDFKFYTLDKRGSVSGGFDPSDAWKNFPACRSCCEAIDFAGQRVKKLLSFEYYSSFKYLFLPLPIAGGATSSFALLDRLVSARVNRATAKRLTAAEDELFYVVSEEEDNRLQVDLLFYQPDPQSFRPAMYVSGLLPSRFQSIFKAKSRVDGHPWLQEPGPQPFVQGDFTFGSLNAVFPHAHGGSRFDDDFMAATRAALELRRFPSGRLLQAGMRWVREDYVRAKPWQRRMADLFRSLLFFEQIVESSVREGSVADMAIDYGTSEQADRVRRLLEQAPGKLRQDPSAQASFLIGASCSRIEMIQQHARGSSPFSGKLKGFRLSQPDVQSLFVAAKDKSKAYGPDEEAKVSGLLECAAAALAGAPDRWALSPDEVSYFFALGHTLRSRLAKAKED